MKYIFLFLFSLLCNSMFAQSKNTKSLDRLNSEIWNRYVNKFDIINDYTDLNGNIYWPTAEEMILGKPNALGWWTPFENGSMFGGLYMDGAIKRMEFTKAYSDSIKVRRLAKGLLKLASVSPVVGAFTRGVTSDGQTYYAMGSDDQAGGWLYGMWRYLQTALPDNNERTIIEQKFIDASKAMVKLNWALPADSPFMKRGSFFPHDFRAARLLFVCKACYELTKDPYWNNLYISLMNKTSSSTSTKTRLDILKLGISQKEMSLGDSWHNSPSVACLRLLWELEKDSAIRDAYRQGLEITATNSLKSISNAIKMTFNDTSKFDIDWRKMNIFWRPQSTDTASENVAITQLVDLNKRYSRRIKEHFYVREPCFAAWHITLAPDQSVLRRRLPDLLRLIDHYNYKNLYEVWFFPLEAVGWRLNELN